MSLWRSRRAIGLPGPSAAAAQTLVERTHPDISPVNVHQVFHHHGANLRSSSDTATQQHNNSVMTSTAVPASQQMPTRLFIVTNLHSACNSEKKRQRTPQASARSTALLTVPQTAGCADSCMIANLQLHWYSLIGTSSPVAAA